MKKVYVVSAYRYGWRNGHSYVVGCCENIDDAKKLSVAHMNYRGGKYGCEIVECNFNDIDESGSGRQVHYIESPYYGQLGCHDGWCEPAEINYNKKPWKAGQ